MIDLRSDTITKPTPGMLDAMMSAEVGDDVFDADPTVNALQEKIAKLLGKEAALYCPSGTMTNQIALRVNTRPQDEVVCHKYSHIHLYEGGGLAYNSMLSPKLLEGENGKLKAEQIAPAVNPDDIHFPKTSLVSLENTMNKGGGSYYELDEVRAINKECHRLGLRMHLDGARFFNALTETQEAPEDHGALFDTVSICFSKGLGAPVGSALVGSSAIVKEAKRVRKALGGGMRQAGFLAAACIYALDHHVERLAEDHQKAREIGVMAAALPFVREVIPVKTNIVIVALEGKTEGWFLEELRKHDVHAVGFGPGLVRFVTHLDFHDDQLQQLQDIFKRMGEAA